MNYSLIFPSIIIFILSIYFSIKLTKNLKFSLFISIIKVFLYFYFQNNNLITIGDDMSYFNFAKKLNDNNITIINFIFELDKVFNIVSLDSAIGYYLINLSAFHLFGEYYSSPVALNIIICILISYFSTQLFLKENLLSADNYKLFYIFISLNPIILTWSSILNVKDMFVMLLTLCLMYGSSLFFEKKYLKSFLLILFSSIFLFYTRYYLPVIFILTLFLVWITSRKNLKSTFLIISSLVVIFFFYNSAIMGISAEIQKYPYNAFLGVIRMLLTPVPFSISEQYDFLFFSSIYKFLIFPMLILGIISSYLKFSKIKFFKIVIFYLIILLILIGSYEKLQGPRQRLQIEFLLIYFEFIGLLILAKSIKLIKYTSIKKK